MKIQQSPTPSGCLVDYASYGYVDQPAALKILGVGRKCMKEHSARIVLYEAWNAEILEKPNDFAV
ncbi:hypothetical protein NECAME_16903 [Necator americanus]|uniref:Uncharacterized protein n=1 Tax=Necator americanus TaxID=51031 RepID=W2TVP4_NECAM|nr:hypothetical protein NECAME_16903 [Necator americanus]ETN85122.1 hypothetical protein NECAME_16903 [Necator americanus]